VICERSAQAGFPEVLFNLFPGMGGWNLAIRRGGFTVANDLILSGQIYTADQLYRRGLVDIVVEDGEAPQALERMVHAMEPRFRGTMAALQARRVAAPISHDMLADDRGPLGRHAMSLNTRTCD
jgi:DSF synthase